MKKTLTGIASALLLAGAAPAIADDVKVGILLGFTGPIESLTPDMAAAAELALKEATDSGKFMGGKSISAARGDSTCTDSAAAQAAAERLVSAENVVAIMGADCSGVTTAVANNVAVPNGVTMISPSATSPALTTIEDNGFFFRTSPSDARQGQVLADILKARDISEVAVTYTNNDYGKGLADSFAAAFEAAGGKVAVTAAHEDGKADYSAEVGALSASGAPELAVFGYVDQGGRGIIQASIDSGAFERFIFADGMVGESLIENVDGDLTGSFGTLPGSDSDGAAKFTELANAAGAKGDGPFTGEAYDAAALLVLAMQAGNSTDRKSIADNVMGVANAPGEKIYPGELAKALEILASGGEVDYEGATNVQFSDVGEAAGSYKELEIKDGKFETMKIH
jgi:branched-chain amino acid transport system substrate-binding protein